MALFRWWTGLGRFGQRGVCPLRCCWRGRWHGCRRHIGCCRGSHGHRRTRFNSRCGQRRIWHPLPSRPLIRHRLRHLLTLPDQCDDAAQQQGRKCRVPRATGMPAPPGTPSFFPKRLPPRYLGIKSVSSPCLYYIIGYIFNSISCARRRQSIAVGRVRQRLVQTCIAQISAGIGHAASHTVRYACMQVRSFCSA